MFLGKIFSLEIFKKLRRRIIIRNLLRIDGNKIGLRLKIGDYFTFEFHVKDTHLNIGEDIEFRNYNSVVIKKGGKLVIGDNTFFNNYCSINVLNSVEIGANTLFGEGVRIYDHNHQISDNPNEGVIADEFNSAPIKIGSNCWLGSNVVVLKGVTIGDNTVIGAGIVVHKDVPPSATLVNEQNLKNVRS